MSDNKHQRRDDRRAGEQLEWEEAPPAAIRTWRERIGVSAAFPLHAATNVERAMEAEIAELRGLLALAAPASKQVRPSVLDLPNAIMNLPCTPGRAIGVNGASLQAYKEGHRDARHAAADLVLERADELAALATTEQAARDVLAERRRQVDREGYNHRNDDAHVLGELGAYAAFYTMPPAARDWPATETGYGETWGEAIIPWNWSAPKPGDRRRELVKAGALILAEIERLDRAEKGGAA